MRIPTFYEFLNNRRRVFHEWLWTDTGAAPNVKRYAEVLSEGRGGVR